MKMIVLVHILFFTFITLHNNLLCTTLSQYSMSITIYTHLGPRSSFSINCGDSSSNFDTEDERLRAEQLSPWKAKGFPDTPPAKLGIGKEIVDSREEIPCDQEVDNQQKEQANASGGMYTKFVFYKLKSLLFFCLQGKGNIHFLKNIHCCRCCAG